MPRLHHVVALRSLLCALPLPVALGNPLTAQADWHLLAPAHSPSARSNHAMVYDQARTVSVMFGGMAGTSRLGDTWQWDGTDWTQAALTGATPPPRDGHAMAYDAARQETVLFGGFDDATRLDDTWVWNGSSWTLRNPANRPPARREHAMAYDPLRQRVVLFGGNTASGNLADTWEWDGSTWLPVFTTTYPPAMSAHLMAFASSRIVVNGAVSGWPPINMYFWNGIQWSTSPFGNQSLSVGSAMAFDHNHGVLVRVRSFGSFFVATEVWNGDWTAIGGVTNAEFPSGNHPMAFDDARQCLVIFGGVTPSGLTDSTWINRPPSTPATATTFGTGCGTPPLTLTTDPAARPILGQTAAVTATNAPTSIAAAALGWSNQTYGPFTLPVTLAGLGMPGCDLWQSADILNLPVSSPAADEVRFSLSIPNRIDLIGVHLFAQIYAVAPNENAAWIVISDAVDWMLGDI